MSIAYGRNPFEWAAQRVVPARFPDYGLQFEPYYYAFDYFDLDSAKRYYAHHTSTIVKAMLGLIAFNEKNPSIDFLYHTTDDLMLAAQKKEEGLFFYYDEDIKSFDLKGEVYSGILQAKISSFFMRMYVMSGEGAFLDNAYHCLRACMIDIAQGGVKRSSIYDTIWVEEYPTASPSMVLNGFVFVVIALAEYEGLRHEGDPSLKSFFDQCLYALLTWMPVYRYRGYTLYSLYRWHFCNIHYLGVIHYQMEHLYRLTGLDVFREYSQSIINQSQKKIFHRMINT